MLTTATPGAQALSIVSSAASPSKAAPYPTDVGTATTGADTSPATTLGRRAVHSRHHDDDAGRSQQLQPAQDPVQPGHADVDDQLGVAAQVLRREQRLPRDRQVRGTGAQHEDAAPDRLRHSGRPGHQSGHLVDGGVGQDLAQHRHL